MASSVECIIEAKSCGQLLKLVQVERLVKHQRPIPLDKGSKEELRLGGGFEYFLCSPRKLGKWSHLTFDEYFSDGLKPPTWRIALPENNSSHLKTDALLLNAVHVTARFGAVKTAVGWV